jgi:hypothetical protein
MNSTSRKFDPRPATAQYRAFAQELGPILSDFDPFNQLILLPGLIAARGRASSFAHWTNDVGFEFSAECHYIDSPRMDGYAGGTAGSHYLSLCDAVGYAMFDLFAFLFSMPTFFPTIGDPTLEDIERVARREKPVGYGFFRRSITQVLDWEREIVPPRCSTRGFAALYFAGMAMDLVWTHELSHGVHGHIDFAQAKLGLRALNEQPNGEGDLRLMPMEAEADRFAVIAIVQTAMVGKAAPYFPQQLSNLPAETRVTAALVVAAVMTWFWAFQQKIDRTYDGIDPYTTGSHPPPLARLHLAFDMARQFLSQQGWTTQMVEKTIFEAMANLEAISAAKSWFSIMDPARSFGERANSFVKDVKTILGDSYREIDASLEPYRYVMPEPAE